MCILFWFVIFSSHFICLCFPFSLNKLFSSVWFTAIDICSDNLIFIPLAQDVLNCKPDRTCAQTCQKCEKRPHRQGNNNGRMWMFGSHRRDYKCGYSETGCHPTGNCTCLPELFDSKRHFFQMRFVGFCSLYYVWSALLWISKIVSKLLIQLFNQRAHKI